jgi:hypothetical protein
LQLKYTGRSGGYKIVLTDDSSMSFSAFQNFLNDPNRNMQNRPGPSLGMPRTADFQDRNFNRIDDRDEPGGSHYNPNNPKKPIGSKLKPQSKTKPVDKPKVETKPKAKPSSKPSKEELARRATREKKLHNKMKDF